MKSNEIETIRNNVSWSIKNDKFQNQEVVKLLQTTILFAVNIFRYSLE